MKRLLLGLTVAGAATAALLSAAGEVIPRGTSGTLVTALEGTRLEEIPLLFLGTYEDFGGPGRDLHLVELQGPVAEQIGVASGMSGSPVYIEGRLLGALAYRIGNLPRTAVGGVTPIESMLDAARAPREGSGASHGPARIATPVSAVGLGGAVRDWLAPRLEELGLLLVAGGTVRSGEGTHAELAPGSPVGVELVRGDLRMAATGTVTWVDGDIVYAFGHPFLGSGRVEMPMVYAEVLHTVPDLAGSFKMARTGGELGAIVEDRFAAVVGDKTRRAAMLPLTLNVRGADYGEQSFHFEIVRHSPMAPLLAATSVANALQTHHGYNRDSTIRARGRVKLRGYDDVSIETARTAWDGADPTFGVAVELLELLGRLWSNPFEELEVEGVELELDVLDEIVGYRVEALHYDRGPLRPGDTLEVACVLQRYRGERMTRRFEVVLPTEIRPGSHWVLAAGNPAALDTALGRTLSQRLATAPDLESYVRALGAQGGEHRLSLALYEVGNGVVSRGSAYSDLPPTAEGLLSRQMLPAAAKAAAAVVKPLATWELELDGPVIGGRQARLRFGRGLEAKEDR